MTAQDCPQLVWVQGLRGPEAQKWLTPMLGANGKERPFLKKIPLKADEVDLPIRLLAKVYPAPTKPKDAA
jgi:hypothetical protein